MKEYWHLSSGKHLIRVCWNTLLLIGWNMPVIYCLPMNLSLLKILPNSVDSEHYGLSSVCFMIATECLHPNTGNLSVIGNNRLFYGYLFDNS